MARKSMVQNYYEVLEVSPQAPQNEIHAAYQRAKSTYSDDSPALYTMFSREEARELMNLIEEAFTVLGNQAKRRQYDLLLRDGGDGEPLPDFQAPTPTPPPKQATKDIPTGYGRTKISVYPVDDTFEKTIHETSEFTGPFLAKVRQYKQITLEQMSNETRVSKSYLAALEGEDYAALPAPVFIRGFVTQVAKTLGLNDKAVSTAYMDRYKKASL